MHLSLCLAPVGLREMARPGGASLKLMQGLLGSVQLPACCAAQLQAQPCHCFLTPGAQRAQHVDV